MQHRTSNASAPIATILQLVRGGSPARCFWRQPQPAPAKTRLARFASFVSHSVGMFFFCATGFHVDHTYLEGGRDALHVCHFCFISEITLRLYSTDKAAGRRNHVSETRTLSLVAPGIFREHANDTMRKAASVPFAEFRGQRAPPRDIAWSGSEEGRGLQAWMHVLFCGLNPTIYHARHIHRPALSRRMRLPIFPLVGGLPPPTGE